MIAVTCSQCDKRLKVREDLAGKRVRCPGCQQLVPVPDSAGAAPPAELASLHADATLPPRPHAADSSADETLPPVGLSPGRDADEHLRPDAADATAPAARSDRYQIEDEIARGGMGAVMRARDQDIRRHVAVKYLLNQADARQKARFIEEAQITGQLGTPTSCPSTTWASTATARCTSP